MAQAGNRRHDSSGRAGSLTLDHRRAVSAAWRQTCEGGLGNGVGMLVIAIALALPATLFELYGNLRDLVDDWGETPGVTVFLERELSAESAQSTAQALGALNGVAAWTLIAPETAFAEFSDAVGYGSAETEQPPLPHVVVLTPEPAVWAADRGRTLAAAAHEVSGVDSLLVDLAWVDRLAALSVLARRSLWILGLALLAGAALIIGNIIRVAVHQRTREIEVLRLVGASNAFVRRPFLYSGVIQGLFAGALAALMVEAVLIGLQGPVASLAAAYDSSFRLAGLAARHALALVCLSAVIGWMGAWLGTYHSLNRRLPGDL